MKIQSILRYSSTILVLALVLTACGKSNEAQAPSPAEQKQELNSLVSEINSTLRAADDYNVVDYEKYTKDAQAIQIQKLLFEKLKFCSPFQKNLDNGFIELTVTGKAKDDLDRDEEQYPMSFARTARVVKQTGEIKKTTDFFATTADLKKLSTVRHFKGEATLPKDFKTSKNMKIEMTGNVGVGKISTPENDVLEGVDFKGSLNLVTTGEGDKASTKKDLTLEFSFKSKYPSYTVQVKMSESNEEKLQVTVAGEVLNESDSKIYTDFLYSLFKGEVQN